MGKKSLNCFLVVLISFLSIVLRGYSFGLGDQAIHLPLVFKLQDHSLYPNDYLFIANQASYSIFYDLATRLYIVYGNIYQSFLVLYIISTIIFFILIYKISKFLFSDNLTWFIASLFFIFPYYVGGSAIMTVESSFVPRYVAFLMSLLILYLILRKKYLLSWSVLGFEFLVHSISAITIGTILGAYTVVNRGNLKFSKIFIGVVIFILIVSSFVVRNLDIIKWSSGGDFKLSSWLEVIHLRNSYAFPLMWSIRGWLSLMLGIFPLVVYLIDKFLKQKSKLVKDKILLSILLSAVFTLIFQIVFTSLYPVPQVINLQLGRFWLIPITLSFICLGNFISRLIKRFNLNESKIKLFILIILIGIALFKFPNFKQQNQNWIDIQLWINKHTSNDCIILVPFYNQGFRIYSERSITGEYKDGTVSFYSPNFAKIWNIRLNDLKDWEKYSLDELIKIQYKYNYSFFVTLAENKFPLNPIYNNGVYTIYQMPNIKEGCSLRKI